MSRDTTYPGDEHPCDDAERIRVLRQALAEGEASGDAGTLVFDEIRRAARAGLRAGDDASS